MKRLYDTYTIYEFSDECIVKEICKRVKSLRLSCCFSQQEFADKAGVYKELTVNVRWYEERADYSECISVGDLHWQIELGL